MKVQILQENLERAINIATRFASTKAQLPILANILISTRKSKILISSTNLEISASVQVGAKVEEEGEISIPAKIISELSSNLPKETIDLQSDKEQLKISTSGFNSTVLGMNSTDFPKIPSILNSSNMIVVSRDLLANSLGKVIFSTSTDETRPILTGVLFIIKDKQLFLVATDGFRLSRKSIVLENFKGEAKSVVIPKGILNEISRGVFETDTIAFDLEESEKQVLFELGDTVFTSRLLEGEYPDFEKIIPKESSVKVLLDKEEFLRAVKLASIFAKEAANVVKLKILKDSIKVFAESGQSGSQEMKVDAKVEKTAGGEFEIAFNFHYLEDFLHSVAGEELSMEFINSTSAGVFKDTGDANYLHLIMPVKT